jgi:hypothetical protein
MGQFSNVVFDGQGPNDSIQSHTATEGNGVRSIDPLFSKMTPKSTKLLFSNSSCGLTRVVWFMMMGSFGFLFPSGLLVISSSSQSTRIAVSDVCPRIVVILICCCFHIAKTTEYTSQEGPADLRSSALFISTASSQLSFGFHPFTHSCMAIVVLLLLCVAFFYYYIVALAGPCLMSTGIIVETKTSQHAPQNSKIPQPIL